MGTPNGFEGRSPDHWERWRREFDEPSMLQDPGPEWITMKEAAEIWGLSLNGAASRMRKLGDQGRLDYGRALRVSATGVRRPVQVYRLKPT